jgi:PAS domain S-box-containing protein/diguanylate cyclase (GGDEF)-like protein
MSDTLKILLLEGSDDDAQLVMGAVHGGGLKAVFHHQNHGGDLPALLEIQPWDLILCNFQLEDISALEILVTVHRLNLDLPVIVISDGIGEELAVTVMHAGAHDFITKNNLSRLVPAIERELEELEIHRQHRAAEAALRESEQRFRQLTENIGEVFWLLDARSGEMIYLSPAFEDVWEQPSPALLDDPGFLLQTVYPEDYSRVRRILNEQGWLNFNAEYRIQLRDGTARWINTRSFPIKNAQGDVYRVAGLSIDVTERKHLAEEREMMSRALEQSADAVMITDAAGDIVYVNQAFCDISGYAQEEVLGRNPSFLKSGFQEDSFYELVWKNLSVGIPFTDIFINRRKDGELYYEAKTITPVRNASGELTHFVSTGKDITSRLKTRERLQNLVHYDAVTGLANRFLLHERMGQAILQAQQNGAVFGVMCVGLELSELLGGISEQKLTEKLLHQVALRLTECLKPNATVARMGSDEFYILLKGVSGHDEVEAWAKSLVVAFAEPISAVGYKLFLSPSVGISLYPGDGADSEALIEHAGQAMKQARSKGQGAYHFYQGGAVRGMKRLSS